MGNEGVPRAPAATGKSVFSCFTFEIVYYLIH